MKSLASHANILLPASLLVVLASLSILVIPVVYSPMLVVAVLAAIGFLVISLFHPQWPLLLVLLVVMLPGGLLPDSTQSFLNRSLTLAAAAVWLINTVIQRRKVIVPVP